MVIIICSAKPSDTLPHVLTQIFVQLDLKQLDKFDENLLILNVHVFTLVLCNQFVDIKCASPPNQVMFRL